MSDHYTKGVSHHAILSLEVLEYLYSLTNVTGRKDVFSFYSEAHVGAVVEVGAVGHETLGGLVELVAEGVEADELVQARLALVQGAEEFGIAVGGQHDLRALRHVGDADTLHAAAAGEDAVAVLVVLVLQVLLHLQRPQNQRPAAVVASQVVLRIACLQQHVYRHAAGVGKDGVHLLVERMVPAVQQKLTVAHRPYLPLGDAVDDCRGAEVYPLVLQLVLTGIVLQFTLNPVRRRAIVHLRFHNAVLQASGNDFRRQPSTRLSLEALSRQTRHAINRRHEVIRRHEPVLAVVRPSRLRGAKPFDDVHFVIFHVVSSLLLTNYQGQRYKIFRKRRKYLAKIIGQDENLIRIPRAVYPINCLKTDVSSSFNNLK